MMKEFKKKKDRLFSYSLAKARVKLAVINSVLVLIVLGLNGGEIDYIIATSYFFLNLVALLIPFWQKWVITAGRIIFLTTDLVVMSYMIARTGGSESELFPFLFIPVFLAVLRSRYPAILTWCSLMALILVVASLISETLYFIPLTVKIAYLFLFGILGGYLVHQSHTVNEEVSKSLALRNIDLQRLNKFSAEVAESSDLEEIFRKTLKIIFQSNSSWMSAFMIFDEHGILKIFASAGWKEDWLRRYQLFPLNRNSLTLTPIIVLREPILCPDIKKHPELVELFLGIPVQSLFAFPILVDSELVGILMITSPEFYLLTEDETQIMNKIANQASQAIQNVAVKNKSHPDGP